MTQTLTRPVLGILGGGQLGRMLALAAAEMGVRCHVFAPEAESVAAEVAEHHTCAAYADEAALTAFAASVDVITYEFENIPVATAEFLEKLKPVRPSPKILAISQDRLLEKQAAKAAGLGTTLFLPVASAAAFDAAPESLYPAILKTRRDGYDGKGQVALEQPDANAWDRLGGVPALLEKKVAFAAEVSVIIARGVDGKRRLYPLAQNHHEGGILRQTIVPAGVDARVAARAFAAAARLAAHLELVGLLAIEFFVTEAGEVLFNECAPRPHNSGHWTIEGAQTSQFAEAVRAVLGWPLGATGQVGVRAKMENLIGEEALEAADHRHCGGAAVHLYGKTDIRPGRKLGHVTWVWRRYTSYT
jgi:5-(carboxyamino)imidazole ribonucleotide synthase